MSTITKHASKAYKILTRPQHNHFQKYSTFSGSPLDLKDGYIHLSSAATAGETYSKYFAPTPPATSDIVVLEIDLSKVAEESGGRSVKWEESRGGQLFPHVYGGPLEMGDVLRKWEGAEVGEELFVRLKREEEEEGKGKGGEIEQGLGRGGDMGEGRMDLMRMPER